MSLAVDGGRTPQHLSDGRHRQQPRMIRITNLIGGVPCPPENERWLEVFEPATGKAFALAP